MTHSDLVVLGHHWLTSRGHTAFCEFSTYSNESPDVIGWKGGLSILLECKASRSDFLSDGKKPARRRRFALGRRRYYLCPWGLIDQEELPDKWGLLWAKAGRIYRRAEAMPFPEYDLMGELRFLNSMLRRADIRVGDMAISDWLRWENRRKSG
jgi:hypothetical protein